MKDGGHGTRGVKVLYSYTLRALRVRYLGGEGSEGYYWGGGSVRRGQGSPKKKLTLTIYFVKYTQFHKITYTFRHGAKYEVFSRFLKSVIQKNFLNAAYLLLEFSIIL